MRKDKKLNIASGNTPGGSGISLSPLPLYQQAVVRLREVNPAVDAIFDRDGRVRSVSADLTASAHGILSLPYEGNALIHARKFLETPTIKNAFALRHVNLVDGAVSSFEFGSLAASRVEMKQTVRLKDGTELRVRGGFVHVTMDSQGHVINATSTVKFGRRPNSLPKSMVSQSESIEICKRHLKLAATDTATSELVLSEHDGNLGLVYEVKLVSREPRFAMQYLVLAKTGEVVHEYSLIKTSITSPAQNAVNRIPVRTFLSIPDPKKKIADQVVDHFIETLPDPKVLKNHRFVMKVKSGRNWSEVNAKADGSYNFNPDTETALFSAAAAFVALNEQFEFLEKLGMKKQTKPISVFMDDPSVTDNAYFDPENYEIHMGVGSGPRRGLAKNIGWDLGVEWHENGHHVVMLQTPGADLPGDEGGAMHESTGDVLGQLVMDYLWGVNYGVRAAGAALTLDAIKKDPRIIGRYALPPNGIRIQRNTKKTPRDKTGEVHDDGLISGGAHADLLEAMIDKAVGGGKTIADGVTDFARLNLAALVLVPAHRVRFVDMLQAMLTADGAIFSKAYKSLIEKAHSDHGITVSGSGSSGSARSGSGSAADDDSVEDDDTPAKPKKRRRKPRLRIA